MHWIHLINEEQLQNIIIRSQEKPQVIFKYNNNCPQSELILQSLQNKCCPENIDFYFLDLSSHKNISDQVTEIFDVYHRSPQILLIKDGECIFQESNSDISIEEILEHSSVII
jgi:bacillithiol system protein YtxJ